MLFTKLNKKQSENSENKSPRKNMDYSKRNTREEKNHLTQDNHIESSWKIIIAVAVSNVMMMMTTMTMVVM